MNDEVVLYAGVICIGVVGLSYLYCIYKSLEQLKPKDNQEVMLTDLEKRFSQIPRTEIKSEYLNIVMDDIEMTIYNDVVCEIGNMVDRQVFKKLRLFCDLRLSNHMEKAIKRAVDEGIDSSEINEFIIQVHEHIRSVSYIITSTPISDSLFQEVVLDEIDKFKKYY